MADKTRRTTQGKRVMVSFESQKLYKALKTAAAHQEKSIHEVVNEAVREYLRKQEDLEDLYDAIEAAKEPKRSWE